MQGYLSKKTTGGKWKSRYFKLENRELSWLKSDNKTSITLKLDHGDVSIRDMKFSVSKKFVFEVEAEGRTICLAASGEAEKQQWIIALEKQANLYKEKRSTLVNKGAPKKLDANRVAGIANVLGLQNGGNGGGMKSSQANDKLKEKLGGTAVPMFGAPKTCAECGKMVYKVEELTVDDKTFHKLCFRCAHCHRELTKTNYAYAANEDSFYCKVHYAELFGGDLNVAVTSIEKTDNPAKDIDKEDGLGATTDGLGAGVNERENSTPQITFAKEAVAIREKKYGTAGENEIYVESLPTKDELKPGEIDNSATLARPKIAAKRQQPTRKTIGKILPPEEIKDRKMHENSFQLDNGTGTTIILHASSVFERNKWVICLANAVYAVKLKYDLEQAQKSDMKAAIQCQLALEAYLHEHETTYQGYLEKLSVKSQRNWKKRFFELKDGQLIYFSDESSKRGKATIVLSRFAAVKDTDGKSIEHEPVLTSPPPAASKEEEPAPKPQAPKYTLIPIKPIVETAPAALNIKAPSTTSTPSRSANGNSSPSTPTLKPNDGDTSLLERSSPNNTPSKEKPPVQIKVGNASGAELAYQLDPVKYGRSKAFAAKAKSMNKKQADGDGAGPAPLLKKKSSKYLPW